MAEPPGELRRNPPRSSPSYAVRAPLARWIHAEADSARAHGGAVRVLDVGCGVKPYAPWFDFAASYVGVDVVENPYADLQGAVEALPVEDGSFDVVLCLQVLEHSDDPAQAVRELRRVTAGGGRVLASTHGVQVYHPSPDDLWRWTHAGLARLFEANGEWSSVTVQPGSGTAACLAMLVSIYADLAARRAHAGFAARPFVSALNRIAEGLDHRSALLRGTRPGTLHANYHVTAEVAA
jgi:SAM-dependent methyltransferase